MHGRAKVKTSVSEQEKKKKERELKVKIYKQCMSQLWEKRKNGQFDQEALNLITEVLSRNPDIYTLWNFRRQILTEFLSSKENTELNEVLRNELSFTESCLKINPKSYSAWHHRQWALDTFPQPNLNKELQLCTLYLKMDERNFHCWDYRRWVAAKLNVPNEKELDYTMEKINENFSNYSSWHYRSKLLPRIYPDPDGMRPICEQMHLSELDLVVNAAFTDPNDQSAWFYQRWLLGRTDTVSKPVRALLTSQGELFISFTSPVSTSRVKLANIHSLNDNWDQPSPCLLRRELDSNPGELEIVVEGITYKMPLCSIDKSDDTSWSNGTGLEVNKVSPALAAVLTDQLNMCNQLLEYEPSSKWTLLTSAHIMMILDRSKYKDKIVEQFKLLEEVDLLRVNYYSHQLNKFLVECALDEERVEFSLTSCNLRSLHHIHYLLLATSVDLSHNCLSDKLLDEFICLRSCKKLNLVGNKVTSLLYMPKLPLLESLSIKQNNIQHLDDILPYLANLPSLKFLDLSQNPVCKTDQLLPNNLKIEIIL